MFGTLFAIHRYFSLEHNSLVRYLRARTLDLPKAEKLLLGSLHWRKSYPVPVTCDHCNKTSGAHCLVRGSYQRRTCTERLLRDAASGWCVQSKRSCFVH